MTILGFAFEGPFLRPEDVPAGAGVYVPMDHRAREYFITDVGESNEVRGRLISHERAGCWRRHTRGELMFFVRFMPGSTADQRRTEEKRIRDHFNPPCGEI